MTDNAFTRSLSGAEVLVAICFIGAVMFFVNLMIGDPAPPSASDAAREIAREQYVEQRRAQRRVAAREVETNVALYCKHYGEKSVACRDMRIAAGIER